MKPVSPHPEAVKLRSLSELCFNLRPVKLAWIQEIPAQISPKTNKNHPSLRILRSGVLSFFETTMFFHNHFPAATLDKTLLLDYMKLLRRFVQSFDNISESHTGMTTDSLIPVKPWELIGAR
jgi:hypothetical protein